MTVAVARIGDGAGLAIDVPAALNLVGILLKYLGLAAVFPIPFALGYGEPVVPFVVAGVVTSGTGLALERITARWPGRVGIREGFLVVALVWLLAAGFAAIPYLFQGGDQLSSPLDAYFEGMSGFTTTGASVVTDVSALDRSLEIWRQYTQWLGGMAVLVLAVAVLPRLRVGGRQLMESALPGTEISALADRIRSTARKLWLLYVGLTLLEALALAALWAVGIDDVTTPYEALAYAFSTMSTGGFSPRPDSAASLSAAAQWILVLFMAVAGANFVLMFRAFVRRRPRALGLRRGVPPLPRDPPCRVGDPRRDGLRLRPRAGEAAARSGVFQAVSMVTTTGLSSADFALWPPLLLLSLFALMFVGGSAGSTSSGIRVVRHLLLAKILRREVDQTLSPEFVMPIRLNGSPVDERTVRAIAAFVLLYLGIWAGGAAIVSIDSAISGVGLGTLDALAASATTLGNIGPAFGIAGPHGSYADLGDVSKLTLIGLMWVGRLEIVPVVVLLTRHYWRL